MPEKMERPGRLDEAAATKPIHSGNQTGVDDISMREIRFSRYAKQLEAEKAELTEERRQNTSAMQAGLEAIEQLEAEKAELKARMEGQSKRIAELEGKLDRALRGVDTDV